MTRSSDAPPLPNASPIAHEVYRRMKEAGMVRRELSVKANLGPTYVRDLFIGKSRNPKSEQLQQLADVLKCKVTDLTNPIPVDVDPRLRDFVKPADIYPLFPGERGLIQMWRAIDDEGRDRIIDLAASLLPRRK